MLTLIFLFLLAIALVIGTIAIVLLIGFGGWAIVLIAIDICILTWVIKGIARLFSRKK